MTQREAAKLSQKIHHDDTQCKLLGFRRYEDGQWAIDLKDLRTGDCYTVNSEEDWTYRFQENLFI